MPESKGLNLNPSSVVESETQLKDFSFGSPFKKTLFTQAIELAFLEDFGEAAIDLTTSALKSKDREAEARIYCKSGPAIIAGLPLLEPVFQRLGSVQISPLVKEGASIVNFPQAIAVINGPVSAILSGERIALNLLQRMCSVATTTSRFVEKAAPFNIAILDTRKTTPGLRLFEKYAVLVGGGTNHRFGLNDAILIKDNHIEMCGGIGEAVKLLRLQYADRSLEVECTSLDEVRECLDLQVNRILLDNMSGDLVKKAMEIIGGRAFIEVSGGVNLTNIENYLQPGVNAISIGAITHSSTNVDLSLEVEK